MKTTITLKPKMRMTSRAIEALVKSTGISYETSTEKSGNKYGFVDVIWCNGYKFKSAKAFGNYLTDIAGTLIDCGVASKELIEDAHMAGQGGLADLMPKDRTQCVEVSPLHCKILLSRGFMVECADFMKSESKNYSFDRVVMNPPFSDGRWQSHVKEAGIRVKDGGRLVAILPSSARNKELLPGFDCEFHGPYDNEFAGTGVSVVILVANRR